MAETDVLTIHTDGAARGNPGPAAYAFVITKNGALAAEDSGCLGDTTNNVAEYTAMVKALQRAKELGGRHVVIHSDSELMVKQMLGEYKVKHEGLRPLYEEAQRLTDAFEDVSFRHVPRGKNKRADELCNLALDGAAGSAGKAAEKTGVKSPAAARTTPKRAAALSTSARDEILDCLRSVACVWSAGNPNVPRPEEVWEQLWTILEDANVLKSAQR